MASWKKRSISLSEEENPDPTTPQTEKKRRKILVESSSDSPSDPEDLPEGVSFEEVDGPGALHEQAKQYLPPISVEMPMESQMEEEEDDEPIVPTQIEVDDDNVRIFLFRKPDRLAAKLPALAPGQERKFGKLSLRLRAGEEKE